MCILCNNYLKPHDSVQWPRVSRYSPKSFRCIFWNSFGVLHDGRLQKSVTVNSDVYYLKLTHIAGKYRFHYDKKAGLYSCTTTLVRERQTKRNTAFLLKILTLTDTHRHGYKRFDFTSFPAAPLC